MRSKYLLGCATIVAGGLLASGTANAQALGPLVKASGGSPFNHCTADQAATQPGTNFAGSAIEPWIAADPTTQGHLLTGTQQDRWSNGGSRGLQAAVTINGGRSYVKTQPQGVSLCQGGRFQRSTDPWTAFDLNGTAYFFSLSFNNNPSPPVNGESALFVSRSTDGGASWQAPVTVIDDTDPLAFNDKNAITADPTRAGYVYAVWDRLYGPPLAFRYGSEERGSSGAAAALSHDGLDLARGRIAAARKQAAAGAPSPFETFGPTYYARSTDSGQTFGRAVPIYDPGRNGQTIGNVVVVAPNGTVFDFFTNIDRLGNLTIQSVRSLDHGFSFSKQPALAVPATDYGSGQAVTPDSKQPIRQSDIIFSVSVDQKSGVIALAWENQPAHGNLTNIYYSQSYDGDTWSAPIKINQTPASSARPLRGEAFNMAVAAGANNTLVATYYDFRNDVGTPGQELADMWAVFCTNTKPGDCARAKNWGGEVRMTNTSFNYLQAPLTDSGYFLGDYFGLVAQGQSVTSAFTATNGTPGQTDLYTRGINLAAVTASR